jgi:hypothetical protein
MPDTESGRELRQKAQDEVSRSAWDGYTLTAAETVDAVLNKFVDHVEARHESEVKACDAGDDDEEYQMYMEGRVDALGALLSDLRPALQEPTGVSE